MNRRGFLRKSIGTVAALMTAPVATLTAVFKPTCWQTITLRTRPLHFDCYATEQLLGDNTVVLDSLLRDLYSEAMQWHAEYQLVGRP